MNFQVTLPEIISCLWISLKSSCAINDHLMLSVAFKHHSFPPPCIAAGFGVKMLCFSAGQISDIHVTGESEDMTAKERLLFWSKQITDGYVGVRCDNFTTSWRDGRLFNAIIHRYRYTHGTKKLLGTKITPRLMCLLPPCSLFLLIVGLTWSTWPACQRKPTAQTWSKRLQ